MKLLVFSDSHGDVRHMARAVEQNRPDMVLHLGDINGDLQALRRKFPARPMECVSGTGAGRRTDLPEERVLEVAGRKILMMHGHSRRVKMGIGAAVWAAREAGADILLFGHTHEPVCEYEAGLWILNPGTIRGGWSGATYGVLSLEGEEIGCCLMKEE